MPVQVRGEVFAFGTWLGVSQDMQVPDQPKATTARVGGKVIIMHGIQLCQMHCEAL